MIHVWLLLLVVSYQCSSNMTDEAKCCLLRLVLKDNVNNHNWRMMIPKVGLLLLSHESSIYCAGSSTSTESSDAIMFSKPSMPSSHAVPHQWVQYPYPKRIEDDATQSQLLASHGRHPLLDPFLAQQKECRRDGLSEEGKIFSAHGWLRVTNHYFLRYQTSHISGECVKIRLDCSQWEDTGRACIESWHCNNVAQTMV